jgi:hypothetical protein
MFLLIEKSPPCSGVVFGKRKNLLGCGMASRHAASFQKPIIPDRAVCGTAGCWLQWRVFIAKRPDRLRECIKKAHRIFSAGLFGLFSLIFSHP